ASLWFAVIDRNGRELRRGRIATGANWFVNWADFPSLRVLDNGDWVTHYLEKSAGSTYAYDVRLVRSTDRGKTWSTPVTPHTDGTPTQHGFVSLSPLGGDRVLVVWLDGRRGAAHAGHDEDGPMTLRSAVLDRSGARQEERELDDSTCSCCQTDAVRIADRTLIAYRDRSAAEVRDIAVAVRSNGGAWSKPKIINPDGWKIEACPVNGPAVASHGERVLTIWPTQAGGPSEVRFAVAQPAERGTAHALDAGLGTLGRVDAAAWRDGFLVSWLGGGGGGRAGLQLAHIGAGGEILTRQTLSNVPPTRMSGNPRLAADRDRALIAWIEPNAQKAGNALAVALLR
ncbi:MAG: sialidase family protein, partial [Steroidobacteraceae bacterium]